MNKHIQKKVFYSLNSNKNLFNKETKRKLFIIR
jgi:hypothetical protein